MYEISISPGIWIEEAKTETRLKKRIEGHTTITLFYPDGEPKSPKGAKTTVVNQCGYYVRAEYPHQLRVMEENQSYQQLQ